MITKFTENVNNETIIFMPALSQPFVNYDIGYYTSKDKYLDFCGPLIILMKELAKLRGAW